jgi:hypothetical protein
MVERSSIAISFRDYSIAQIIIRVFYRRGSETLL